MKRLLVSAAFIIMGTVAFAQAPAKAKSAPAPATTLPNTASPVAVDAVTHQEIAEVKKDAKKECSDADKKQCGSKSGEKKSCCSHKTEATKEETK